MSEFKGTKGKWKNKELYVSTEDNKTICSCYLMTFEHDKRGRRIEDVKSKYNALLISKAPEMLEMLKLFTDFPDEDFKENESNNYYTFSVKISDMIKAKQLIKEATEL